jgi:hypothetical protein
MQLRCLRAWGCYRKRKSGRDESGGLTSFKVLQTGVQYLLHSVEFGTPEIPHIIEAAVNSVESGAYDRR